MEQHKINLENDTNIYIDMYSKGIELTLEIIETHPQTTTLVLSKEQIFELILKLNTAYKNLKL